MTVPHQFLPGSSGLPSWYLLAAGALVPVRLSVGLEGRLPERLKVAAYYVVGESLANSGKHAQATSAAVEVSQTNGQLVVEIVDGQAGRPAIPLTRRVRRAAGRTRR
jgi:signal transduction histidine kinase